MKKVFFWCLEANDTKFYSFVTNRNVDDYLDPDDILLDECIIDDLQNCSQHGTLNNWGVVKIEDTNSEVSSYEIDDSLSKNEKRTYLTVDELENIKKEQQKLIELLKTEKIKDNIHDLDSKSLKTLYVETAERLEKILIKISDAEYKENTEKKVKKREELLKVKGFVSESGWIDRSGKYWNVQSVDHDDVAVLKWGSIRQAERSNIRISSTGFGLYILYSYDAKRPPNNKQFATLYRWAEHFGERNSREVETFEKEMNDWFMYR